MLLKLLRLVVVVLALTFVSSAKADALSNTVIFDGSYSFADSNGYGIPPYGGTLNGQAEAFFCVDFSHEIQSGDSWTVTIASLTGSSFGSTRLGNQTSYSEMAWLVTQMMGTTDQLLKAQDQYAIWSLSGGPDPYGTNSALLAAALTAATTGGFTGQGWEILTPTGSVGQEFLIYVPEPGALLLLMVGLVLLGTTMRKKSIAGAQAH
jgi:hypothetical protein